MSRYLDRFSISLHEVSIVELRRSPADIYFGRTPQHFSARTPLLIKISPAEVLHPYEILPRYLGNLVLYIRMAGRRKECGLGMDP